MKELRIVFFGTPEFAVGILEAILQKGYDVAGVVTAQDKPSGRGQKIKYSPVKEYALEKQLRLLQPANLKDDCFIEDLKKLNANLQIVVAFRMLPKSVWGMPALGTINLHASLLPNYRGAAPINWVIINGETKTGVTTFFIDDKIDTGNTILSAETKIEETENAEQLHDSLMTLGSKVVLKTLALIGKAEVKTTIQKDFIGMKTAYKLNRENCKIDWTKPATEISNKIRGLSPYPSAWCYLYDNNNDYDIKIYEAKPVLEAHKNAPGTIICTKKEIKIAVIDGYIEILSLQLPGKRRMTAIELLNGVSFSENSIVK